MSSTAPPTEHLTRYSGNAIFELGTDQLTKGIPDTGQGAVKAARRPTPPWMVPIGKVGMIGSHPGPAQLDVVSALTTAFSEDFASSASRAASGATSTAATAPCAACSGIWEMVCHSQSYLNARVLELESQIEKLTTLGCRHGACHCSSSVEELRMHFDRFKPDILQVGDTVRRLDDIEVRLSAMGDMLGAQSELFALRADSKLKWCTDAGSERSDRSLPGVDQVDPNVVKDCREMQRHLQELFRAEQMWSGEDSGSAYPHSRLLDSRRESASSFRDDFLTVSCDSLVSRSGRGGTSHNAPRPRDRMAPLPQVDIGTQAVTCLDPQCLCTPRPQTQISASESRGWTALAAHDGPGSLVMQLGDVEDKTFIML